MESDSSDFTLPPAPRGLCFDRNDFVKTHFSVDTFLADHENGPSLETLRDDLGVYLKVLRLAMIELINKDYANFVNLSATLIGFDKTIEKIQEPLSQLNVEVMNVKQSLEDAMKELSMWLNQRNTLHKKKQTLKYYSQTLNSLKTLESILNNITDKKITEKIVLIDRAAMEYNQLTFSITKCDSLIKTEHKNQFKNIGESLTELLNDILFKFWTEQDEINLLKTLLTLASLNKVSETELLIRKQAIAPLLQDIINETNLQRNKDGLQGIYAKILSLLENKLKLLRTVMQHSKLDNLYRKYNFIVNCFWCEVESRLVVNLASIFAPGNPKIFYKRYSESMDFVKKLEEYCGDGKMVLSLHDTAEYKSFQKRWNLPVYFQIRFQEIAGSFESTLHHNPTPASSDFKLTQTVACWNSIQECWADGVYIEALAHKFWKLTLQMLLRYCNWCCDHFKQKPSKPESATPNKELLLNSINIYIDAQSLIQRTQLYIEVIKTKIPITNTDIIQRSLQPTLEALQSVRIQVIKTMTKELYEYFNSQIKQVSDIPRLYRKTNRSVPNKPCPYIEVIKKYLINFNEETSNKVDYDFIMELYKNLFDVLTVSYYKYVEDVLTSVQKTEESLRRLKQIREMSSTPGNEATGVSDGDKIRLQLHMDIAEYGLIITTLKIQVTDVEKYNELTIMIKETVKNIINIK